MNALIHFLTKEWYFAVPMILMSLTGVTLVVWRLMLNRSVSGLPMSKFLPLFEETLRTKGTKAAMELCEQPSLGYIPNKLFVAGLQRAKQGAAAMKRNMANTIELEILPDLNFLLAWILAIAKIATMVGLLGTVISMINTFNAIGNAVQGGGNATSVGAQASSIGLALFATALGLMTAIPLVFAHVLFKDWIVNFETRMKWAGLKLLDLVQNTKAEKQPTSV